MTLAKWTSNESSVMGEGIAGGGFESQYVKVLGISWDPEKDQFTFKTAELPSPVKCTKRVVLSLIARVFDPLGFVLPVTVSARFLFQDVWRLGLEWDEELPETLQSVFSMWLQSLHFLQKIAIPCQYFDGSWTDCVSNVELHAFGDASLKGFGAMHLFENGVAIWRFKVQACSILCSSCSTTKEDFT